jgi:hypothetical protein
MPLRSEKDIRQEIRNLRDKGKSLSGFWVSELAAAAYALEWVLGKKEKTPANDVGEPNSGHGKLAESISKAAERQPPAAKRPAVKKPPEAKKPAANRAKAKPRPAKQG